MLLALPLMCIAQEVNFSLTKYGKFVSTEDGKDYVVLPYEGKTAQELYSMVKSNVLTFYNSPKDVMSENEPASLTIRARTGKLQTTYRMMGGVTDYYAYYNLSFHFKDGRIKVDAPYVDPQLIVKSMGNAVPKSFSSYVDDWFDKQGNPKENKKDKIQKVERIILSPVLYLLGYTKDGNQKEEEDW